MSAMRPSGLLVSIELISIDLLAAYMRGIVSPANNPNSIIQRLIPRGFIVHQH